MAMAKESMAKTLREIADALESEVVKISFSFDAFILKSNHLSKTLSQLPKSIFQKIPSTVANTHYSLFGGKPPEP